MMALSCTSYSDEVTLTQETLIASCQSNKNMVYKDRTSLGQVAQKSFRIIKQLLGLLSEVEWLWVKLFLVFFNQVLVIFYLFFVFLMATSESFSTGVVFKPIRTFPLLFLTFSILLHPQCSLVFGLLMKEVWTCAGHLPPVWLGNRGRGHDTSIRGHDTSTIVLLNTACIHSIIKSWIGICSYHALLGWKLIGWPHFHSGVRTRRLPPWVKP